MSERAHFLRKILSRLDRVDKKAIEAFVSSLFEENQAYLEMLDRIPAGVMRAAPDGTLLYVNEAAAIWTGLPGPLYPPRQASLKEVQDDKLRQVLENAAASPKRKSVEEVRVLEPKEIELRVFSWPFEKIPAGQSLIVLVNITPEKIHESAKQHLLRNDALLRLGAGIAHEIGNPLNAIDIHLTLMLKEAEKLPGAVQKNFLRTLQVLQSETRRLDGIVRNFLKAVRRPVSRFRPEDLNQIIQEAVDFFTPELHEKKMTISFQPDRALGAFFLDRSRMREVFDNLIKNAMEAMPKGGNVSISVTHKGKLAMVRIRDQGMGISDRDLPHIFEAYYTTKKEGSGLGLMVVYNIIAEHGGRIEVETKPGKGTTFAILLPIRNPRLQLPGIPAAEHPKR
ncbi:MAG TPA: ATP-binding protein [Verrucomicrobiae bacterium]|jgi:signal transduction histidine kinase|nr:ATP-binding protein [Verrucomicrobiae bacterium]